jgi:hypothetical protein
MKERLKTLLSRMVTLMWSTTSAGSRPQAESEEWPPAWFAAVAVADAAVAESADRHERVRTSAGLE